MIWFQTPALRQRTKQLQQVGIWTKVLGQIALRCTRTQDPKDAVAWRFSRIAEVHDEGPPPGARNFVNVR
jgi:hypothetical protein